MKKNYKNILIICSVVIVLVFMSTILLLIFSKDKNTVVLNSYFDDKEEKTIDNCALEDKDECLPFGVDKYLKLVLGNNYPVLNKKIDKINKDTIKLYEQALKSDVSSDECSGVKDKYTHQISNDSIYDTYEDDKYVSVSVQRYHRDLCIGSQVVDPIEIYIYDIKQKKIISQEEFIKELKITEDETKTAIDKNMNAINPDYVQDTYNELEYYYGYYGELYVSYYSEGLSMYYSTIVRESDKPFTSNLQSPK